MKHQTRNLWGGWLRLATAIVIFQTASAAMAAGYIDLGDTDPLLLKQFLGTPQPMVQTAFITEPGGVNLGPNAEFGFNSFVLDTGAQTFLAAANPTGDMKTKGYTTVSNYTEQGVSGFTVMQISSPMTALFAGTNGDTKSMPGVQILSSETLDLGDINGLVGMPAMVGRVVSLNNRPLAHPDFESFEVGIDVSFPDTLPALSAHQYVVPLTTHDFPLNGQQTPGGPLPTASALSMLGVNLGHLGNSAESQFLLDTGAQITMISSALAAALHIDANGNGEFDGNELVDTITVGGIGGEVEAPVVRLERLAIHTTAGIDLIWHNLEVGVIDIDPAIAGVFGNDMLVNSWLLPQLGEGEINFDQVDFDFRSDANRRMILTVNPEWDIVVQVPEPSTWALAILGSLSLLAVGRRRPR